MELNVRCEKVLSWYDGPLLFLGCDQLDKRYLCLAVDEVAGRQIFLCAHVSCERLAQLENAELDLRSAFTEPQDGELYTLTVAGDCELFPLEPIDRSIIPEEWLPSEGCFGF